MGLRMWWWVVVWRVFGVLMLFGSLVVSDGFGFPGVSVV